MVECVHRGGVVTRIASASHNGKDRQQFVYEVELPPAGKAAVAQKYSNENFMTVKESSACMTSETFCSWERDSLGNSNEDTPSQYKHAYDVGKASCNNGEVELAAWICNPHTAWLPLPSRLLSVLSGGLHQDLFMLLFRQRHYLGARGAQQVVLRCGCVGVHITAVLSTKKVLQ